MAPLVGRLPDRTCETVLIDTLARGGEGLGPAINRQIAAFRLSADVNAKHNADTQEFFDDLAKLSDELAARAGDLVAGARDLNQALPDLNARGAQRDAPPEGPVAGLAEPGELFSSFGPDFARAGVFPRSAEVSVVPGSADER